MFLKVCAPVSPRGGEWRQQVRFGRGPKHSYILQSRGLGCYRELESEKRAPEPSWTRERDWWQRGSALLAPALADVLCVNQQRWSPGRRAYGESYPPPRKAKEGQVWKKRERFCFPIVREARRRWQPRHLRLPSPLASAALPVRQAAEGFMGETWSL